MYSTAAAAQVRVVPDGNRYRNQPSIPFASARRTKAAKSSYDAKFEKVLAVLQRDRRLVSSIKRVAKVYGIDPIHMIGAIVGEHTYNYDTLDSAQSYYIKALAYAGIDISFEYNDENVVDFVQRPQFDRCRKGKTATDSDRLWSCYERVWNGQFRNRKVDGTRYPRTNFNETFFQPLFCRAELRSRPAQPADGPEDDRPGRPSKPLPRAGRVQCQGSLQGYDGPGHLAALHGSRHPGCNRGLQIRR